MKNKILPITFIFLLISFCFINNCFAYQLDTTKSSYKLYISDKAYEKLQTFDEYKSGEYYYFVRFWDNNTYQYFFFHANDLGDIKFVSHDGAPLRSTGAISNVKEYDVSIDNDYSVISEYTHSQLTYTMNFYTNVDGGRNWGYISNFTIYWDEACTNVFFYQPPIVLKSEPTLAGVLAETNPTQTFQTMMSGIIPYLVVFLVGLVAFWKAWSILSKELRKA